MVQTTRMPLPDSDDDHGTGTVDLTILKTHAARLEYITLSRIANTKEIKPMKTEPEANQVDQPSGRDVGDHSVVTPLVKSDVIDVVFRSVIQFDDGVTRRLHVSKCDGEEFTLRGGSVMGDEVPDRIYKYVDGEAHFVRWA